MRNIEDTILVKVDTKTQIVDITGDLYLRLKLIVGSPNRFYKLDAESSRLLNKKATLIQSLHILNAIALQSGFPNTEPSTPE